MGFMATLRRDMRTYKEIIPLIVIMGGSVVGVSGFCVYSYVSIMSIGKGKMKESPPHEYIRDGQNNAQRMYLTAEEKQIRNNPKVESLRRELGVYKLKD